MKITVSKILNRTDLAKSGSHGGLVVTREARKMLMDFFEAPNIEHSFIDKEDEKEFKIHYIDYTSNGTTPNDRISPIGKYAVKHKLMPGDNLILQKTEINGIKNYYIAYARKMGSVYFVGKSKEKAEVLNYEQFLDITVKYVSMGKIRKTSPSSLEMQVRYQGETGLLAVYQKGDTFELYFNGKHIEENKKYYELDTLPETFELKKTDTWKLELETTDVDDVNEEEADEELLRKISKESIWAEEEAYSPKPENKKAARQKNGSSVPARSTETAWRALARAGFMCENDKEHKLFIRRAQPVTYTEPHHIIPMKYDEWFEKSLDVQANIVSLCSHCHNLVHYGVEAEIIIRKLWELRKDEMAAAGLGILKNGTVLNINILLGFYGIE